MLIEAVDVPIRYQWPQGEIRMKPGKLVEVDEFRGLKVLAKCGPKVRMVSEEKQDLMGKVVRFVSPLLGMCSGRVSSEYGRGRNRHIVIVEEHSVLEGTVTIPKGWIRSVKSDVS